MASIEAYVTRVASELEDLAESHHAAGDEELGQTGLQAAEALYAYAEALAARQHQAVTWLNEMPEIKLCQASASCIEVAPRLAESADTFVAQAADPAPAP